MTGLTTSGSSFLWWLNGVNRGSSIAPTQTQKLSKGTAFIWDMTQSGLDANNTGDTFSICQGATIFGLTSSTGTSKILYIGFHSSLENLDQTVDIKALTVSQESRGKSSKSNQYFNLDGTPVNTPQPNRIYIRNGKKVLHQ